MVANCFPRFLSFCSAARASRGSGGLPRSQQETGNQQGWGSAIKLALCLERCFPPLPTSQGSMPPFFLSACVSKRCSPKYFHWEQGVVVLCFSHISIHMGYLYSGGEFFALCRLQSSLSVDVSPHRCIKQEGRREM